MAGFGATLRVGVVLALCLSSYAQAASLVTPEDFLRALEGSWTGRAEVTPVGPRPYDIRFLRVAPNRIEGEAHPGASVHYWAFHADNGALRLRFLSTFAGNEEPTYLDAVDWIDDAVLFKARKPDFLKLRITPGPRSLKIDVLHHDKLHVAIRLTRPDS